MLATLISTTHTVAHLAILGGYLLAMVLVPRVLAALIYVRPETKIAGAGFFLFCGVTHVGITLHAINSWPIVITDHLQAVAIWVFVIFLAQDLRGALGRVERAFGELGAEDAIKVAGALQATYSIRRWDRKNRHAP
jgi:hypothetical protein